MAIIVINIGAVYGSQSISETEVGETKSIAKVT